MSWITNDDIIGTELPPCKNEELIDLSVESALKEKFGEGYGDTPAQGILHIERDGKSYTVLYYNNEGPMAMANIIVLKGFR